MTTPPGWYADPEPARTAGTGARERWWDGTGWTGQTRTRGAARGPLVAGIVGALVLLAALAVGAVLVFGGSGVFSAGTGDDGAGGGKHDDASRPTDPPDRPDPRAEAPADGVDLPVLDGWQHDPDGPMAGTGEYTCPGGDGKSCLRGSAVIVVAGTDAGDPEDVARNDIERFAELAYSKDTYGGITSHKVLATETATVAGQDAYRVRWKIVNRKKPDAYVESVAFPHPDGSGEMLLLRTGFDIHRDAPPLGDMDRLAGGVTEGARKDAGEGGTDPGEQA
ncbi:MAG: DUF2510 domain-containing protein [Streptomyces sp.]|uniref:DUF2510 domain-containing protein n=1 Tax=Streptomyces sp. TaxID=1931 RepID=UPI003D6A7D00